MADSLFDNRYRYDYIYPRGRSGETLRAVDTQDGDRHVVVKRPAPNDAPPIRAGQEVSILNERKALTRLAGHPVLTALLGGGQFNAGGMQHQYIVVERAEGAIIADAVLELSARGERLPELEMLVIVDLLLDLLSAAHEHDVVYNDVDAKHLFWNRDTYALKVIDWGNAIFLEGDESTPQGISRQSDIYQVGELLYFIVSGGGRADIPREAGDEFRLDFGRDTDRVHSRLQAIIARAVHPNLRLRHRTIAELRKDLADYRAPIERERNTILGRVVERLRRDRSKDELRSLLKALEPALAMDPGYPPGLQVQHEILDRLSDIEVGADLDATRIYLESGNWSRALALLDELRARARGDTADTVVLLLDWAKLLHDADLRPTPLAVPEAVAQVFERQTAEAAHTLLTQPDTRDEARKLQLLLAERISAHSPDILLLRPNLYRLDAALAQLSTEGIPVTELRAVLAEIIFTLYSMTAPYTTLLIDMRDVYRVFLDGLTALSTLIEAVNTTYKLPNRKLPVSSLERALNAAMALADNMHVIGKQAASSPRDALAALDNSRAIDPANVTWEGVGRVLNALYELLGTYQIYVPAADGSDLDAWLRAAQRDLQPFSTRLFDEMLVGIMRGLEIAEESWRAYGAATIQGNRIGAITALANATEAVGTVSPTLAGWLNQLRQVVTGAHYIERHALYGALGRALADGWENYDRGRLADAERLGGQAFESAHTDAERAAAKRLRDLAETTRGWVERNTINDARRTQATLVSVEKMYTVDENATREAFTRQMPSNETYLKAMSKGLVELYARSSTAAVRILFFNYILLAVTDAHEGRLEDAAFWREAALKTLGDYGARHPTTRAFDEFSERRRDINAGAELLNTVTGQAALATLATTRKALEENPQAKALAAGVFSLRELEASLRDWSDGEFRAAGIKLENALKAIDEVEQQGAVTLTAYRAFIMELLQTTAELHAAARQMAQMIETKPDEPLDMIRATHHKQVEVTTRLLGASYAATLRQWRDTYDSFVANYTDRATRRSARLTKFSEYFRAMFIDRHPAYPLYRHWYTVTENAPEFPAPPTDEPTPRIAAEEDEARGEDYQGTRYTEETVNRRRVPRLALVGALLAILVIAGLVVGSGVLNQFTTTATPTLTALPSEATGTATPNLTATARALLPTNTSLPLVGTLPPPTERGTPVDFIATPSLIPSAIPLESNPQSVSLPTSTTTLTPSATLTLAPTLTLTPTATFTPSNTPTPTLPPQGLQGTQDILALLNQLPAIPWESERFSRGTDGVSWRLGIGSTVISPDPYLSVALPVDLMETHYGNNAAARLRRTEATLTLTTFNPTLLSENQVFFGIMLQNVDDPTQVVGLNVHVPQAGVINLGQRQGDAVQTVAQQAVGAVAVRVRLERDPNTGNIAIFVNNQPLGQPIPFTEPIVGLQPMLFVSNSGVIVNVTEWSVTLR